MNEQLTKIRNDLSDLLKKERYEHTIGVMYTAASLAMRYGIDIEKAMLAGLVHDCAKYCPPKEQIRLCKKNGIELSESELEMPALIHARLGSFLAEKKYHIHDQEVLNAVLWHTTGRPDMTLLEKIIYIADYIEPNRKQIPGLNQIRELAFLDIDKAVASAASATVEYLQNAGKPLDPMSIKTYEFYK